MHMRSDGGVHLPLQLKLDTFLSLMPGFDPSKVDLESVNALLSEAFVADGLQADGTPPLVQVIKMPTLNGGISFTVTMAPALFPPGKMDPLTATILLSQLKTKIDENTVKTSMLIVEGARDAFERSQKKSEETMRLSNEAEDRAAAAARDAQNGNISSATMAVVGAILGGVLAFIFGGWPLGVVAIAGAVLAAQELISVGVKSNPNLTYDDGQGGKRHYGATFSDFVEMGSASRLRDGSLVIASKNDKGVWVDSKGKVIPDPHEKNPNAIVMTPKAFNDMNVGVAIGITVFITVMMLAGGIYALRNPADVIKVAERLSKFMKVGDVGLTVAKAENVGTVLEVVETVGNSATQGAEAGLNYRAAEEKMNLANANALKAFIQSMMNAQVQQMQLTQEFLNNLVEALNEALSTVAKTIADTFQVHHQVALNLVPASG